MQSIGVSPHHTLVVHNVAITSTPVLIDDHNLSSWRILAELTLSCISLDAQLLVGKNMYRCQDFLHWFAAKKQPCLATKFLVYLLLTLQILLLATFIATSLEFIVRMRVGVVPNSAHLQRTTREITGAELAYKAFI